MEQIAQARGIGAADDDAGRPPVEVMTLDVAVTRGGHIESRHRVHAAIMSADGRLLGRAHDPALLAWWRSCAKPFQLMPMLEDGSFDSYGWGDEEMALACASHGSEPEHVAVATRMLAAAGVAEADLACGPHTPLSARGIQLLRDSGTKAGRLHSNCSGKHAAMLARAVAHSWDRIGYQSESHPVQIDAWHSVAKWCGLAPEEIARGVDGCGVTVYAMPLSHMALAYARLAAAAHAGDRWPSRIVRAMTTHAHLVGGTNRFDTLLMQAGQGNIVAKVGAEGVHSVGVLDAQIGIAIKVEDGAERAQYPAVLACLQTLGALPARLPDALAAIGSHSIVNTRAEIVGRVFVPGHEVVMHG